MGPFRTEMPVVEEGCVLDIDLSMALSSDFEILAAETAVLTKELATMQQHLLEYDRGWMVVATGESLVEGRGEIWVSRVESEILRKKTT